MTLSADDGAAVWYNPRADWREKVSQFYFRFGSFSTTSKWICDARLSGQSRDRSHSLGIPLVATNQPELNENDRAGRGDRRKDVFA